MMPLAARCCVESERSIACLDVALTYPAHLILPTKPGVNAVAAEAGMLHACQQGHHVDVVTSSILKWQLVPFSDTKRQFTAVLHLVDCSPR